MVCKTMCALQDAGADVREMPHLYTWRHLRQKQQCHGARQESVSKRGGGKLHRPSGCVCLCDRCEALLNSHLPESQAAGPLSLFTSSVKCDVGRQRRLRATETGMVDLGFV